MPTIPASCVSCRRRRSSGSSEAQLADTRPFSPLGGIGGPASLEPEDRLRLQETQLAGMVGIYSEDHPDIKRLRREIANLKADTKATGQAVDREDQLTKLRNQLAVLRQKYSDDHPDVVALRRTYAALEDAVKAGPAGANPAPRPRKPDNPTYVSLKAQIDTTSAQIESSRAERSELQARLHQFEVRLSQTPEVEREYLELARDLDSSRARFREMRDKQMQAQVAEQLERGRKGERFTIIEPPVYPERPYRPNRQLIMLMGLVLAIGGSLATVAVREALDATVHGPKDMLRMMQVPVLSVVPAMPRPMSAVRRAMRLKLVVGGGIVVIAIAALLLHNLVIPLDVAWYALMRRIAG